MIEINLVPGTTRRSKRRVPKVSLGPLSKLGGGLPALPKFNRALLLMAVGWGVGLGLLGWMVVGVRMRESNLKAQIEAAQLDSARLEGIIKSTQDLEHRRNVVAQKVTIVQDIDASRYVWAHLLDEVARAVPEYTWLVSISNMVADSGVKYPHFQIQGRTGNNFALTKYLQQLEASPFVRKVMLKESQLVRDDNKLVYAFTVEADYEVPPPDVIETTPLFVNTAEPGDSATAAPAAAGRAPGGTGPSGNPPAGTPKAPARKAGSQEPR